MAVNASGIFQSRSIGFALERKSLIQPAAGLQPFRLTKKGKEFIVTQIKEWETFVAKLNRLGTLERFAKVLGRVSEESQ